MKWFNCYLQCVKQHVAVDRWIASLVILWLCRLLHMEANSCVLQLPWYIYYAVISTCSGLDKKFILKTVARSPRLSTEESNSKNPPIQFQFVDILLPKIAAPSQSPAMKY